MKAGPRSVLSNFMITNLSGINFEENTQLKMEKSTPFNKLVIKWFKISHGKFTLLNNLTFSMIISSVFYSKNQRYESYGKVMPGEDLKPIW